MSSKAQRDAREALRQLDTTRKYLEALAAGADIPVTPDDLRQAIKDFRATLVTNQDASNAMVLAVLQDEPCPVSLFKPWASYAQIRLWSKRTDDDRLETELLNGKLCVRPRAFFAALKKLGKPREATAA
jgi:hypothetical protein